jgi:hypothetical protein
LLSYSQRSQLIHTITAITGTTLTLSAPVTLAGAMGVPVAGSQNLSFIPWLSSITQTGTFTFTNGSSTVGATSTAFLAVGDVIGATSYLWDSSVITAINSATQFTVSQAAVATGAASSVYINAQGFVVSGDLTVGSNQIVVASTTGISVGELVGYLGCNAPVMSSSQPCGTIIGISGNVLTLSSPVGSSAASGIQQLSIVPAVSDPSIAGLSLIGYPTTAVSLPQVNLVTSQANVTSAGVTAATASHGGVGGSGGVHFLLDSICVG